MWKRKWSERHRNDSTRFSGFKRKKSGSFSPEHYFKGESTAHQRELQWGPVWGGTHSRNLPSIHEFFPQIKLHLFFFLFYFIHTTQKKKRKARVIHSARLHDASTYSPFRFESVYGEKNALERKKKYRFSPSSFSPPYGFRLPCRTVGLSCRRLQHQLSRQAGAAHFKVRHRLPGPDSCIKNNYSPMPPKKKENQRRSFPDTLQSLRMKRILKVARLIPCPARLSPRFTNLFPDHEVAATSWGPYQRQAILSQLPEALERQK